MNKFPINNLSKNEGFFQHRLTEIFNAWVGTRKIRRGRHITLCIMLILGAGLLFYSVYIGGMIGVEWYDKDDSFEWHMNNYIVMEA